jgi:uncharacterized repeat protein (TIGR01451 family)
MNRTSHTFASFAIAGVLLGAALTGCTQHQAASQEADAGAQSDRQPASMRGHYRPRLKDGESASVMAFPTGEVGTSAVLLHQVMPDQVRRGEDFTYSYHVTNLTDAELQNVVVSLDSTNNLEVVSSDPAGGGSGGGLNWPLGTLGPNETRVITVTGNAADVGVASECVAVSYNNFLCATTRVVEPALALTKTASETALRCEPIVLRYVVRNTGSGPAREVTITDTLPEGLVLSNGSREVRIPVGVLGAGESKAFEVRAEATRTGTFESPATVRAGDLTAGAAETSTLVTEPVLEIAADCGRAQYLGRNFTHTYTVRNSGDGAANEAVARVSIPAGASLVRASEGATIQDGAVVWNLGQLAPEDERSFAVTLSASEARGYTTNATVNAFCAEDVSESCSTDLRGIPAILLEVVDAVDPVEVGQQTTYVITVTNQGSAPDRNIRIVATLPGEQSFVAGAGATEVAQAGNTITFAPLPVLGVGQQAVWRVTVRAESAGDVRFGIEMRSDELTAPVVETEATTFYE